MSNAWKMPDGDTFDPDEKRAEVDDAGLDWETEWLLEDEENDEVVIEKGNLDLDARLNRVDYSYLMGSKYKPSVFAYKLVNFIKLVNGESGEENESPIIHYDMFDQIPKHDQNLFVAARGTAKTTAIHEYIILYIAVYGEIDGFGQIDVGIYISDTMDNGVKSMRKNLQFRWENSDFLQKYVPKQWVNPENPSDIRSTNFTDVRWEFVNIDGKRLCFRGFGASTGVRGFKE